MRERKKGGGGEKRITTLPFTVSDTWKEEQSIREESQMKVFLRIKSRNRRIKTSLPKGG